MLPDAEMGRIDTVAERVLAVTVERVDGIPRYVVAFINGRVYIDAGIVQIGLRAAEILDEE